MWVCNRSGGSNTPSSRGTESSLTLRWRELDSNFPYAGVMNLVFAPFVSRSIVRVLPEAHPTMAMRVTRPTRLAVVSKKVVQSIRQGFLLERVLPQRRAAARTLRAGCRRSPLAILAPTRRYGRLWTQVGTKQRSLRSNQATGI